MPMCAAATAVVRAPRAPSQAALQVRAVCVMPDDAQPWRCHWYGGSQALVNGQEVAVTDEDRTSTHLGRDQARGGEGGGPAHVWGV